MSGQKTIRPKHEQSPKATAPPEAKDRLDFLRGAWGWASAAVLLTGSGFLAYANAFSAPFVLDDKQQIIKDYARIRPPFSIQQLLATERPFLSTTLALNYAASGLDVMSYHLLNLVLHIACALLLYGFARYTLQLPGPRERYGMSAQGLALATAGLFLLHPIQTESVTYVIQRAEVLASLALLAGLLFAAAAAEQLDTGGTTTAPLRVGGYLLGLLVVNGCGLLSKETVVVLPALFALYDWCFIAKGASRAMLRHWPIYLTMLLLLCIGGVARWWVATHTGAVVLGGVDLGALDITGPATPTFGLTPWGYLRGQFAVWVYYVRLIMVPNSLCFDCGFLAPWPVRASVLGDSVWVPAIILAATIVAALLARRRHPLVTFCLLGSGVVLSPTSSIVPITDAYVEHRLYLTIGFLALLAATAVYDASAAARRRGWLSARAARAGNLALALAAAAAFGALTVARNRLYADPLLLLEDTVSKAPQNSRAQYNLGNEYGRRERHTEALPHIQEAIRLDPGQATYYNNLGTSYLALYKNQEAVEAFEKARDRSPYFSIVHRNLAVGYTRLQRFDDALLAAQRATGTDPANARGFQLLGDAYVRVGRPDDALAAYRKVLTLKPGDSEAQRAIARLSQPAPSRQP